jgi:hypothetical protein
MSGDRLRFAFADQPEYEPFLLAIPERPVVADTSDAGVSRATMIMMAAANLNTGPLLAQFRERDEFPFRADSGEHGVDIARVREELESARTRKLIRDGVLAAVLIIGVASQRALDTGPVFPILLFLAIMLIVFAHQHAVNARVRHIFRQGARDDAACLAPDANVTISGGHSPFVGAGPEISGWSFTVNVARADNEAHEVKPVAAADLYRETDEALRKLGIDGLELRDELFVDGRDVSSLPPIFNNTCPGKPRSRLTPAELDDLVQRSSSKIRHYHVIRVQLWSGQLVLSVFLKYTKLADTLFVETRMRLLPPLQEKYAAYESRPVTSSARTVVKEIAYSALAAPVVAVVAMFSVLDWVSRKFPHMSTPETRSLRAIRNDRHYNFGWAASLRETWASSTWERYFQMVDNDFHTKMIKETLLDALVQSLEKRNICTTTLNEATVKIFNDGVMLTGGSLTAQNLAVGQGAAATFNSLLSPGKAGK